MKLNVPQILRNHPRVPHALSNTDMDDTRYYIPSIEFMQYALIASETAQVDYHDKYQIK